MSETALRATVHGRVHGVGFRAAAARRARELGVLGWVRNADDGTVVAHAEGPTDAVGAFEDFLGHGPPAAAVERVETAPAKVEGHEQFAIRGVPAGRFAVRAEDGRFVLWLEVGGRMRGWSLAKEPTRDPAVRRLALEIAGGDPGGGDAWDSGLYEQGGRVPWPEALDRGHAVFVLHGTRLRGGFALQRTREGERPQWLLVKRRDEHAAD